MTLQQAGLDVRGLTIRRGDRLVVEGLTFSAAGGELVALMGASGTGKTSILRAIGGLDPFAAGDIQIGEMRLLPGRIARGERSRELHRSVGIVFQFHHLFSHKTALQNVWLAPVHVLRQPRAEAERRSLELLDALGVGGRAHAMPHELSGGEAQRVAIARALAVEPPVLLMDEPTASLDPGRRAELAATLTQLAAQGRTVVLATHDSEFARACAHRVVTITGR
ncbi:MAG: amino acid ABC transporter ATP-binding protein [Acidobacteria bacterium]|nr:amino acid ABC transporter ATP-binding protein [Acidobacteriota bacterium]